MRPLPLLSASIFALAAALSFSQGTPAQAQAARTPAAAPQVPSQLPRTVRPLHYTIAATPDAEHLRFTGRVQIDVDVLQATDTVVINAVDMDFSSATLDGAQGRTTMDEEAQTATIRFPAPIQPGRHRLTIDYRGKIYTQAAGLFALDYTTESGQAKRALFTQFEAPDARRFFPGWDEPNFRTPYDLSVTIPAGQQAIGNMPEARRTTNADGSVTVTFQTTPSMSSYLLFLAVGELDRITTRAAGVEIGVVTRRGAGEQGRWALESSAQVVPWYNQYFGTPYPLPKLDNVAGPGTSQFFGAMENWGAIFSFENILLVDPAITTPARQQSIFEVAAHEIAHQWFGDLVTMAWWDDLWLNEGFASWMSTKATQAIHPEWEPLLGRISGREQAIQLDSLRTTHPVVQHITTVEQMSQAFDSITYEKGEAVITMLEDYVGETAWRDGVRAYIRRHRLGNTVTDDLWREIETAAHRPVTAIAHDFTLQPGVPLVRVTGARCAGGRTQVTLTQGQFSRDEPQAGGRWRVPVIAAAGGAAARTMVQNGAGAVTVPGCGTLVVNYGQTGYYRTLYAAPLLAAITRNYAQLRPLDQIGLLADSWSLGLAGYQDADLALNLVRAAPANGNSRLLSRMAGILANVYGMYGEDAAHRAIAARFAFARLEPAMQRLGWTPRANEPAKDAVLRNELIQTLGALGHPATVAEANRRFAANDPSVQAGPLRSTILSIVAANADEATWERLRRMARDEHSSQVKVDLYRLLGSVKDENLARRALELALTPEVGATNASQIFGAVAGDHPDLAFDYAVAHREQVEPLVDASSRSRFFAQLAGGSADPAMIDKLNDYASRHLTPQSRGSVDRAISGIRDRIRVRRERLPQITRWLEAWRG
ncbi:M1 family metallopeptidase [Allosphingosinicella sp.]|uniref:M1 family metallopeptidase n=1 Tax=Allosphingosinicella sp. TaxID=2823234 RepID=UPI0037841830